MKPRLQLRDIYKEYPGVIANDRISMSVVPGEVHAVLGENGAGKSTLMKIIYGAISADDGEMIFDGEPVHAHGPAKSRALGIEMVYQHFALFESVTVVENIALSVPGEFDLNALADKVRDVSKKYGLPIDPHQLVHNLSVGERQRVEIVRCLLQNPKLLILDEPTSVLTPQAVSKLFETLRQLAAEGCSILYISHKLDEVQVLCDSATVLRNGKVTGHAKPGESTPAELARMMVGAELPETHLEESVLSDKPLLEVTNLNVSAVDQFAVSLKNVSLSVHGGEIVGIAGVSGNGQGELVSHISGEKISKTPGTILICGEDASNMDAGQRRELGLAFVPEERLGRGAVPAHHLSDNGMLTGHRLGMVKRWMVDREKASAFAKSVIEKFDVKANGATAYAQSLSGGNLQKFIVGREIELAPKVILVSQPTWGVDVGAAAFIRQTLIDLSRSGTAVLVISEELDELFEVCDRLFVLCQGQLSESLDRHATDLEQVGLLMTGLNNSSSESQASTRS